MTKSQKHRWKKAAQTAVILGSAGYAWLMTATGISLFNYHPAGAGWLGQSMPYLLASLIHIAITVFYLNLASAERRTREGLTKLLIASPLILAFVAFTVFVDSFSLMFERRTETALIESGNHLGSMADDLRSIDRQITASHLSTIDNMQKRMELEVSKPEPGVKAGCGTRCREIRSALAEFQAHQQMATPILGPASADKDLGKALGTLETERGMVESRLAEFGAEQDKFRALNAYLAGKTSSGAEEAGGLVGQLGGRLAAVSAALAAQRGDERNLTDQKFRGLTEMWRDVKAVWVSGDVPKIMDMATVLLIAMAPDFLSLIMALLVCGKPEDEIAFPEMAAPVFVAPQPTKPPVPAIREEPDGPICNVYEFLDSAQVPTKPKRRV